MASEPARGARLLWTTLSLVLTVTFGHTTPCRVPAPWHLCSDPFHHETFRRLSRRPAPFPLVLGCTRPLASVDTKRSERSFPIYYFSGPSTQPVPRTNSPNMTPFGSLVSSLRATTPSNKIRLLRIHASMLSLPVLISKCVQIENRVVGTIVLLPNDAASQEAVVGSAQRVVEARAARAPRDALVQYCLEYLSSEHPDFELEGSARSLVQFEGVLPKAVPCMRCVCAGRPRWTGRY